MNTYPDSLRLTGFNHDCDLGDSLVVSGPAYRINPADFAVPGISGLENATSVTPQNLPCHGSKERFR